MRRARGSHARSPESAAVVATTTTCQLTTATDGRLSRRSLSLALCVLYLTSQSSEELSERAGLALGDVTPTRSAAELAAAEARVDEMDRKMALMLEQQAKLMEMLHAKGNHDDLVTSSTPPQPVAAAPSPSARDVLGHPPATAEV